MNRSTMGGFGEKALKNEVISDKFVNAEIKNVVISKRVLYYSGPLGGPEHRCKLSVFNRWDKDSGRDVRFVGVDPGLYLEIYVQELGDMLMLDLKPREFMQFGEFTSFTGSFKLTTYSCRVKVTPEKVIFEDKGVYPRAGEVKETTKYSAVNKRSFSMFNKEGKCKKEAERKLRKAWARNNGIYSGLWTVTNVRDEEHTSSATITVSPKNKVITDELSFVVHMDEWDDNEALRNLVKKDGNGIIKNIEMKDVFVSLGNHGNSIAENKFKGEWKLYRANKYNTVKNNIRKIISKLQANG